MTTTLIFAAALYAIALSAVAEMIKRAAKMLRDRGWQRLDWLIDLAPDLPPALGAVTGVYVVPQLAAAAGQPSPGPVLAALLGVGAGALASTAYRSVEHKIERWGQR
jgi:hypothetical protein